MAISNSRLSTRAWSVVGCLYTVFRCSAVIGISKAEWQAVSIGATSRQREDSGKKKGVITSHAQRKRDVEYRVKVTETRKRM